MRTMQHGRMYVVGTLMGFICVASLSGQEETKEPAPSKDSSSTARLQFMRGTMQKIEIKSTVADDKRQLSFREQPLLRYSDAARNIADSAVWRVGDKGRPIALVTSEVYRRPNKAYYLTHEFLACNQPRLTMRCGGYTWNPPADETLKFQEFKAAPAPAKNANVRLTQIKQLARKFSAAEQLGEDRIELRVLPTPIDRYELSDKPQSDGAIFAAVWGVNPEALLFIESDGEKWSFAWTRMGAAKVWAKLDDTEVWSVPAIEWSQLGKPTSYYAITDDSARIPPAIFDEVLKEKPPAKQ